MEEIVIFKNFYEQRLYGIIHIPEPSIQEYKTGVIIINPGLKDRVGPHRLYVKIARKLCDNGYYILRFDPHGIGESDGEMNQGYSVNNFLLIQKGEFKDDTMAAIEVMIKEYSMERVILMGLCGGAITALFAASEDKRVDSIVLMDVPVVFDKAVNIEKLHPADAQTLVASYLKKLFNFKKILRVLTFKSNFTEIFRALSTLSISKFREIDCFKDKSTQADNINPIFLKSFLSFVDSKRRILFLIAGNEKSAWEFGAKFWRKYNKKPKYKELCKLFVVKTANHEFASLDAQNALIDKIYSWLNEH